MKKTQANCDHLIETLSALEAKNKELRADIEEIRQKWIKAVDENERLAQDTIIITQERDAARLRIDALEYALVLMTTHTRQIQLKWKTEKSGLSLAG